jgi:hypothetical protein
MRLFIGRSIIQWRRSAIECQKVDNYARTFIRAYALSFSRN